MARVGLLLEGRRIAREDSQVLINGEPVGRVTSGTFSPTLKKGIAMAYVPRQFSTVGTKVEISLRGTMISGEVTNLPFYKRNN